MPLWISGCQSSAQLKPYVHLCPQNPPYTAAQKAELKKEFDALPADSELRQAIRDYLDLRNQTDACNAANPA